MIKRIVVALAAIALVFGTAVAGSKSSSHSSSSRPSPAPRTVTVSKTKYPQSAKHIQDAQKAGHPRVLTIDRHGANKNRNESLKGTPRKPGKDRDEYPPAMFKEGGKGASVRHIDPDDNRGAGSSIGKQTRGLKNGDKVRIEVGK